MKSIDLLNQLVKKCGTPYAVHKKSGIGRDKISQILNKGKNFNPDELLLLVECGMISKTTAYKVRFADGIKKKENLKYVASFALVPICNFIASYNEIISTSVYYVKLNITKYRTFSYN